MKDVRCFRDVELDLSDCKPGTSILIAGNNGIGKSAILRAIAMGLCDRDSAASLLRELEGNFIRINARGPKGNKAGEKKAQIEIVLCDEGDADRTITTEVVEWKQQIIERVRQKYNGEDSEEAFVKFSEFWSKLFVVGYGAGLRTAATAKFTDYFAPDALYSLFKYDTPLQDPELAWRRIRAAEVNRKSRKGSVPSGDSDEMVPSLLRYMLDLDDSANITLEPNGIYVTEHNERRPLDAMGDGHKALIKVTLDILVWYLLKLNYSDNKGEDRNWNSLPLDQDKRPIMSGIVIIDEIEQHLHPKLQRQILKRLNDKFPKIQFIITTHSPLCVSGTSDVTLDDHSGYRIYSISRNQNGDASICEQSIPRGLTSDQILIDYFELPATLNVGLEEKYVQLRTLMLKQNKSSKEQKRLEELQHEINQSAPVLGETMEERRFLIDLKKTTEQIARLLEAKKS